MCALPIGQQVKRYVRPVASAASFACTPHASRINDRNRQTSVFRTARLYTGTGTGADLARRGRAGLHLITGRGAGRVPVSETTFHFFQSMWP
jgi:hypothetical protein